VREFRGDDFNIGGGFQKNCAARPSAHALPSNIWGMYVCVDIKYGDYGELGRKESSPRGRETWGNTCALLQAGIRSREEGDLVRLEKRGKGTNGQGLSPHHEKICSLGGRGEDFNLYNLPPFPQLHGPTSKDRLTGFVCV